MLKLVQQKKRLSRMTDRVYPIVMVLVRLLWRILGLRFTIKGEDRVPRAGGEHQARGGLAPRGSARRVVRAFEVTRLRRELRTLRDRLARPFTLPSLLGQSAAMERLRALVRKVATNDDAPVLITGAQGAGKDTSNAGYTGQAQEHGNLLLIP